MLMRRDYPRVFLCAALLFAGAGISARAQFVSSFGVSKTGYYVQTSESTPVLESVNPFEFYAYIVDSGLSIIDSAVVLVPGGLNQIPLTEPFFGAFQDFSSQAAMDNVYKNGNYTFQVTDVDSDFLYELLNLAGNAYPTIPQLLNYTSLRSVNASADLTLHWLPFQGATGNDYIYVDIEGDNGTVFAPQVDGAATSLVIPAATLTAGATYDVYVRFNKVVDVNATSALGEAIYARETYTTIKTSAGGTVTVNIGSFALTPNGPFQVQVSGTPGATFTLEGTTNFGGWTTVDSITPPTGSGTLSDSGTAANPHRFYRVKAT